MQIAVDRIAIVFPPVEKPAALQSKKPSCLILDARPIPQDDRPTHAISLTPSPGQFYVTTKRRFRREIHVSAILPSSQPTSIRIEPLAPGHAAFIRHARAP
jgi:hypothetical protein